MNYIIVLAITLAISILAVNAECPSSLTLLPGYKNARCLDDTPSGYYFRSGVNTKGWVINLEGGGECVTKRQCVARSKTSLGTSSEWKETREMSQFQSCSNADNPFSQYQHVFIPYCSGDLFFGMDEEQNERAYDLRFSGYHVVMAVVDHLINHHALTDAEQIIITGLSAGGLGVVSLIDEMADRIFIHAAPHLRPYHTAKRSIDGRIYHGPLIVGAPIAGYHFETNPIYKRIKDTDPFPTGYIPWKYSDFEIYSKLWNSFIPRRCQKHLPLDLHECQIAQRSYQTIATPMFIIQPTTDSVVLNLHGACPTPWGETPPQCVSDDGPCYPSVRAFMQTWHYNMTSHLLPVLHKRRENAPGNAPYVDGAFAPACLTHTGFYPKKPRIDDLNYLQAFYKWLKDTKYYSSGEHNPHFHVDECKKGDVLCGICT